MYLEHHGIKGQKWGVRRFQNKDGTLTPAGKRRKAAGGIYRQVDKTRDDVEGIVSTLSDKERRMLGGKPGTKYMNDDEVEQVAKRFVKKVGNTPVAFLDVWYASNGAGSVALATRAGKDYRGKGYASDLVKQAEKWMKSPQAKEVLGMSTLNWFAKNENEASIGLAKKYGFKNRSDYKDDPEWWGGRKRY